MALKWLFFSKNEKKSSSGWELHPQTPVYDALELHHFCLAGHKIDAFIKQKISTFGSSSLFPL